MDRPIGDILHPEEIKQIIAKLTDFDIKDYGSKIWFKQDESLQQLNMQTHVNALMKTDEVILEECVTMDKLKVLIYDLVMTDVWKQKVLPLLKPEMPSLNSFKVYMSVYHEAVVCNLLEILMYYRTAVDESGQCLIELIEYAYSKMARRVMMDIKGSKFDNSSQLVTPQQLHKHKVKEVLERTPLQEMERQIGDIDFSCCMMSISIIRYVSDYLRFLEIGVIHHLVVECNIFGVLVPLIQSKPWLRINGKGEREKYQDSKWAVVQKQEYGRLPKVEAQVWITLYNLFMDPDCRKKYELTEQKKSLLLRLRKYINEVLLDQIPNLTTMLRSLEQLSLMNVPSQPATNPFIVQVLPQMKSKICQGRDWKQIANKQREWLGNNNPEDMKQEVKRMADLYSHSSLEGLMQGFKCAKCSKQAFKRCSKCKKVWYCSKDCQVAHWKEGHKGNCCSAKVQEQGTDKATSSLITQID